MCRYILLIQVASQKLLICGQWTNSVTNTIVVDTNVRNIYNSVAKAA